MRFYEKSRLSVRKLLDEKGKAALVMAERKITKEFLESLIAQVIYTMQGRKTTVCVIVLKNKFEIVGSSACVDPADFDEEVGRKQAYDNAFEKMWELEGYRLQAERADSRFLEGKRAAMIANYSKTD